MERFLLGCAALAVCVGPLIWAAVRIRRRFAGHLPAPVALLFEAVVSIVLLILICEALGTVGLFRLVPVVAVCAMAGAAVALAVGSSGNATSRPTTGRAPTGALMLLVLACGAVAAGNSLLTQAAVKTGSPDFDTQWFHLPFAAGFVQQHSVTALHFVSVDDLHQFFPANVELLHAVGMLAFGRDILSIVLNLAFVALALLAGWCLGRPRGAAPATALAVAVVLAWPQILYMSGGSAMDDVPALAFGLAAVALVAHAGSDRAVLLAAAIAAGLAAGTKATTLAFAVVLAIGACLATAPGRRRDAAGLWALGLVAGGGFWYVRNAAAIGNPVPGSLSLLPSPHYVDQWGTLVHQIAQGTLTLSSVAHALDFAYGPAWWAVCALAVIGFALGLAPSRAGWERAATAAAVANVIAFAFSPFGDLPVNARFLAISGAIGLSMLVSSPVVRARREISLGISAALLVLVGAGAYRYGALSGRGPLAVGVAVVLVGCAAVALRDRPPSPRTVSVVALGVLVIVLGAGFAAARHYLAHRYRYTSARLAATDPRRRALKRTFTLAQSWHGERVGIAGMDLQYPLYGADLSDVVAPLGVRTAHGGLRAPDSCAEWRRSVATGRFDILVVAPADSAQTTAPPEAGWLRTDPAVHPLLVAGDGVTVFRVGGPMHPQACTELAAADRVQRHARIRVSQGASL